jgi:CTP:molybdopterin cytidylyltransferase MocA
VIWTLLLAAGSASRMRGGDKLLEPVGDVPLLRRQAEAALALGPCLCTLSPAHPLRREALAGLDLQMRDVVDAAEGMGASIRAGVAALPPEASAVLVLPADMPEIGAPELRALRAAFERAPDHVIRGATEDGRPGHPVLFPRRLFADLRALSGDRGGKAILSRESATLVPLPREAALTDLDTPEAWAAWRAAQTR